MIECFYIPGLNTYGDESVHIGPLRFFKMHTVLEQYLGREGIKLIPFYPPQKNIDEKIKLLADRLSSHTNIIIIGHSTGGIIARGLSHHPNLKKKIKGIITFGSPHGGSHLADLATELTQRKSRRIKVLKYLGYNIEKKIEFISELSTPAMSKFNQYFPLNSAIANYSIICTKPNLPLGLKMLAMYSGSKLNIHTDGFVTEDCQKWGKVLGNFNLDHLSQIGFFKHLVNPINKKQSLAEFKRMIKTLAIGIKEIGA